MLLIFTMLLNGTILRTGITCKKLVKCVTQVAGRVLPKIQKYFKVSLNIIFEITHA